MPELTRKECKEFEEQVQAVGMLTPNSIGVSCVTAVRDDGVQEKIYMLSFMLETILGIRIVNFAIELEMFEEFKEAIKGAEEHMLAELRKDAH